MIPTVWSVLFDGDRLSPEASRRVHQSETMGAMCRELRGLGDQSLAHAAEHAVEEALRRVLENSLLEVLMPVWRSHPGFDEALDAARQHQGIVVFGVGEHDVVSKHCPRLDVVGPAGTLVSFEFDLRLELTLQSAALRIESDGTVSVATIGACRCAGSLQLDGQELAATVREDIQFPEEIPLDRETDSSTLLTSVR
jgi:hypothetical protein